jgi:hypothetical protein
MPSSTAKYVIPYAQLADTVASLAQTTQDLASRCDLLLGESGQYTIASVLAGVTHSQPIVLSRTYPGATTNNPPGIVIVNLVAIVPNQAWTFYTTSWTGSASTITGFTLATQYNGNQTNRVVSWRFIPVL